MNSESDLARLASVALLGLVLGLFIGWVVWPVNWARNDINRLSQAMQAEYLSAVADTYVATGGQAPESTLARLQQFDDPAQAIGQAIRFYEGSDEPTRNIRQLNLQVLAGSLGMDGAVAASLDADAGDGNGRPWYSGVLGLVISFFALLIGVALFLALLRRTTTRTTPLGSSAVPPPGPPSFPRQANPADESDPGVPESTHSLNSPDDLPGENPWADRAQAQSVGVSDALTSSRGGTVILEVDPVLDEEKTGGTGAPPEAFDRTEIEEGIFRSAREPGAARWETIESSVKPGNFADIDPESIDPEMVEYGHKIGDSRQAEDESGGWLHSEEKDDIDEEDVDEEDIDEEGAQGDDVQRISDEETHQSAMDLAGDFSPRDWSKGELSVNPSAADEPYFGSTPEVADESITDEPITDEPITDEPEKPQDERERETISPPPPLLPDPMSDVSMSDLDADSDLDSGKNAAAGTGDEEEGDEPDISAAPPLPGPAQPKPGSPPKPTSRPLNTAITIFNSLRRSGPDLSSAPSIKEHIAHYQFGDMLDYDETFNIFQGEQVIGACGMGLKEEVEGPSFKQQHIRILEVWFYEPASSTNQNQILIGPGLDPEQVEKKLPSTGTVTGEPLIAKVGERFALKGDVYVLDCEVVEVTLADPENPESAFSSVKVKMALRKK